MIAPKLLEWVADKQHREMLILKEGRKLASERAIASGAARAPAEDS